MNDFETPSPKRILCLPLLSEIWALELRLKHEFPFYDRFIIAEGTKTFAGRDKPLYFSRYRDRFTEYQDKIDYIVIDDLPNVVDEEYLGSAGRRAPENRWPLERHTRNSFRKHVKSLGLSKNDIVIVCDVDEILDIEKLSSLFKDPSDDSHYYTFHLVDFRRSIYASGKHKNGFRGGYAIKYKDIENDLFFLRVANYQDNKLSLAGFKHFLLPADRHMELASLLDEDLEVRAIDNAGWHFSHMSGGFDDWQKHKVQNFSHSESSVGAALVATNLDWVSLLEEFIAQHDYEFNGIDSEIPEFMTNELASFKILLNPKK